MSVSETKPAPTERVMRTLGAPVDNPDVHRRASLTLAAYAHNAAELLTWLDMFGLPPCERALRTSKGERNRRGDYAERSGE